MVLAQMFFEADQGFAEDFKQRSMLSCDVETKRPNADSSLHFFMVLRLLISQIEKHIH